MTGYVYCAHRSCFAIVIGLQGAVCHDCAEHDPDPKATLCEGCDHD